MQVIDTVMKCKNPMVLDPLKSDRKDVLECIFDEWINKSFINASLGKINEQIPKHKAEIARACRMTTAK